jgi:hypothetical protein
MIRIASSATSDKPTPRLSSSSGSIHSAYSRTVGTRSCGRLSKPGCTGRRRPPILVRTSRRGSHGIQSSCRVTPGTSARTVLIHRDRSPGVACRSPPGGKAYDWASRWARMGRWCTALGDEHAACSSERTVPALNPARIWRPTTPGSAREAPGGRHSGAHGGLSGTMLVNLAARRAQVVVGRKGSPSRLAMLPPSAADGPGDPRG